MTLCLVSAQTENLNQPTGGPLLMHSTLIYANPIPAGVCQGVQEDLAPEQTMRHSLIGMKNLQKVTNSREVRSYRQCHEEFPALQSPQAACLCTLWYFTLGQFLLAIAVH